VRGQGVLGFTPPHHQFPQQHDDSNSQRTRDHDSVLSGARRRRGVHAWPARKGYAARLIIGPAALVLGHFHNRAFGAAVNRLHAFTRLQEACIFSPCRLLPLFLSSSLSSPLSPTAYCCT
ncbi:unnamed protein product, partial [Ectocarpus sp. 13 AM-2016]